MFDPGWKGFRTRGPEDAGTLDGGNDPLGVIHKYGPTIHPFPSLLVIPLQGKWWLVRSWWDITLPSPVNLGEMEIEAETFCIC